MNARLKALIVVAHPDDEFALAATAYRISRELFGMIDQVVITNGAGGYRYASLAEAVYGIAIARDANGRSNLPAIRMHETRSAGKILGIRNHYFLEEQDGGFEGHCAEAACDWDHVRVRSFLEDLLARERYDVVFTLLPRQEVHRHHCVATALTLEAAAALPESQRPVVLAAEAGRAAHAPTPLTTVEEQPLTKLLSPEPVFVFDRNARFGHGGALNYQIVVNWVIAEHKSQGLFQTDCGKYDVEQFWAFAISGNAPRLDELLSPLRAPADGAALFQDGGLSVAI